MQARGCCTSLQREAGLLAILPGGLRQFSQLRHISHLCRPRQQAAAKAQRAPLAHRPHIGVCKGWYCKGC